MVIGIGIDIVKIEKLEKAVKKWGDYFLKRVFNEEELSNIFEGKMYYQKLAARFAAKEAIFKATAKNYPLSLKDIVILNHKNGAPFCVFKKRIDVKILLSLTHIPEYAIATAIAQKKT